MSGQRDTLHLVSMTWEHPFSPMLPNSHHNSMIARTVLEQVVTDHRIYIVYSLTIKPHP